MQRPTTALREDSGRREWQLNLTLRSKSASAICGMAIKCPPRPQPHKTYTASKLLSILSAFGRGSFVDWIVQTYVEERR